jgi:SNF2 family DNA or RNA helicase
MRFKTEPFAHQREEWDLSRDFETRALFWEMGTGKSKTTIDTAAHLYETGKIDAFLVVAPNGVHTNWVNDELPAHMPNEVPLRAFAYSSKRAKTKKHQRAIDAVLHHDGLAFLGMSYSGIMTKAGRAFARKFLERRKVFYVLDESQRIKTPGAKRTKALIASGKLATHKRILTGTPITKNPFDVYTQLRFLDADFWKAHGFASFQAFKTHFGIWQERINGATGQRFPDLVAFRDLPRLKEIVGTIASRITKDEVLDLPPKLYSKRYFDLSSEQARLYRELRDEYITFLGSGEMVTAPMAITRLLRLQQVLCGYLPGDDSDRLTLLDENPRLDLLREIVNDLDKAAIIWARFRQDVDQICGLLGDRCVRYDGKVGEDDRELAKRRFQGGDVQFFVGNPAAAATGLTLHAASTAIYYSNSFDLEHRLQSEDRNHRIGQDGEIITVDEDGNPVVGVSYIDVLAHGTVGPYIVRALRNKRNVAAEITGDELASWL